MKQENFTADRVAEFKCKPDKKQSIYWDGKTPGLGLRVTAAGSKSYIFETKLNGQTIRMTIGDPRNCKIGDAQAEASRLKVMTNQGTDPRQIIADTAAVNKAKAAALVMQETRESITLGMAWDEYLKARKPFWGARHYADHVDAMRAGGVKRTRSHKLTEPGTLASLANVRLVDLTSDRITEWAKVEGKKRPGRARLASSLLTVFLTDRKSVV